MRDGICIYRKEVLIYYLSRETRYDDKKIRDFVYCFGTIFGDCRLNLQSGGDYKQTNHDRSVKAAVRRQS